MALRMLVYLGLLSQDLVKRGDLSEGKLPPILPLVLYNGLPEWRAPTEVSELFAESPPGLAAYRPRLAYHLIDEASAVEALFMLEHGRRQFIRAVTALPRDPGQEDSRRSFTLWIKRLLCRKVRTSSIES
jgi:hypothetical protein